MRKTLRKYCGLGLVLGAIMGGGVGGAREVMADDLAQLFKSPESWQMAATTFLERVSELGFRYVDGRHTIMSNKREELRFVGMEVYEARVYFDGNAVRRVELSLYNKGDAGVLEREKFEALAESVKSNLTVYAEHSGMSVAGGSERPNYVVKRHQWVRQMPAVQMEWASVRPHRSAGQSVAYSAEYIKVVLVPTKGGAAVVSGTTLAAARSVKGARQIKECVKRGEDGDVWIADVPMVDQGQKGYCAAATSERVLRYYGVEIDQHKVAQLANTAAEGGTTLEGMALAIGKIGRQFQLDKRELIAAEGGGNFERSSHAKLIKDYNAVAKRQRAPLIEWRDYTANHVVDLQAIWADMNPEILLMARTNQRQALERFRRGVAQYIELGVPLLWSCLVGIYPEETELGQVGVFGHVRLIIGFNQKTGEILYSDSWGSAHVLKRMPLERAWAMTKGLMVLKPRDVR